MNRYLKFLQDFTPLLKQINMATIVIAKRTLPRHYITKEGHSKKKEYLQIAGVPLVVTSFNANTVTLNPLTSSNIRQFEISKQELITEFIEGSLDANNFITNLDPKKYPTPVNISEFQSRDDFGNFKKDIDLWVKKLDNKILQKIFQDKVFQMIQTQGAPFEKLSDLEKFSEKVDVETSGTTHKRFGNQIFNRNCRWCPVADYVSYDDFTQNGSYPFPIGIRAKDFCLPSEMQRVLVEMIRQILTFKHVDEKYRKEMQLIFDKYNIKDIFINKMCHCCTYCGLEINMTAYSSQYKSENNYIEICHRDPNLHFCIKNMYWGHGECNRKQGGYTEKDRLCDAIGLLNHNPTDYDIDTINALIVAAQHAKQLYLTKTN
jgi:hypothetical protein